MAKYDDEKGPKHQSSGRVSRMFKLGSLTTTVGASMVGDRLLGKVLPQAGREARTRKALEKNAARIVKTMGEMKGAAMKLGQMLSSGPIDASHIPDEVKDALAVLQREAPPMPWEMVARQVEDAFDQPIHEVFKYFEPEPLAAASIGQVHKAVTFDDQVVAVKIQYPGVNATLDSDLKNLGTLMNLGRGVADKQVLDDYLAEIRDAILAESDYVAEAENLERFGRIFAARDDVVIPQPVNALTRPTVLTMSYIEGEKLDTWLLAQPEDVRSELTVRFVRLFAWMFHEQQLLHADPHPGNFLIDGEGRFVLLDFGCVRTFSPAFTDAFLEILVALWEDRPDRLPALFEDMGSGGGKPVTIDAEVLEGWLRLVLAPFLVDGEFDFGTWQPQAEIHRYFRSHLSLMKLTPPKEALFYFRVCGGAWGLLQRMGVVSDFRAYAEETALRRGILKARAAG